MNKMRVAVFRPKGPMRCYDLSFCTSNLSLLEMDYLDFRPAETVKSALAFDEFYNIYKIYLENGIVPNIKMNANLLEYINKQGMFALTDGKLVRILNPHD